MKADFHLLDLPSQALAVQRLLQGRSPQEKIAWLKAHGKIIPKPKTIAKEKQVYFFESHLGLSCYFFIDGDEFVFIGDHTTYTVKEPMSS